MTLLAYIYKHDPLGGEELRLSLRSVEANFHPLDGKIDVLIVGDKPDWLTNVTHVEAGNPSDYKLVNIASKVLRGCEWAIAHRETNVVCMEDDYIVLDHVETSPRVYWGSLDDHLTRVERHHGPDHWYTKGFYATRTYFGPSEDLRSWELHRPFPVDPTRVLATIRRMVMNDYPALWRSVYANSFNLTGWQGIDGRYSGVKRGEPGIPFASLDDVIPAHLATRFTTPSRWEAL